MIVITTLYLIHKHYLMYTDMSLNLIRQRYSQSSYENRATEASNEWFQNAVKAVKGRSKAAGSLAGA